jgi:hypothetical protein
VWTVAALAMLGAGLTQGALGFGFPAISTPILALFVDVKSAIILNLLPNFTVNVVSIVRGGNWGASLGRYWPVALWVLVGSWIGASFLILAPQEPIRLLLGVSIFAYLYQGWLAHLDWRWLSEKPRLSAMVFGLAGGFFSGSVNQSLPPAPHLLHAHRAHGRRDDADPQSVFHGRQGRSGGYARVRGGDPAHSSGGEPSADRGGASGSLPRRAPAETHFGQDL